MTNSDYIIREIEPRDNEQIKSIVQQVILEMGAPKINWDEIPLCKDLNTQNLDIRIANQNNNKHIQKPPFR